MKRDRIVEFASSYLNAGDFSDYCVNGLQVAGVEDVSKVVSGVSISARLIGANQSSDTDGSCAPRLLPGRHSRSARSDGCDIANVWP